MKINTITGLVLLSIFFYSCARDQFDSQQAGNDYCKCLEEANVSRQPYYALKICDAELIKKYRYYRLFTIEMSLKEYQDSLSKETKDSVRKFMDGFFEYRNMHCTYFKP